MHDWTRPDCASCQQHRRRVYDRTGVELETEPPWWKPLSSVVCLLVLAVLAVPIVKALGAATRDVLLPGLAGLLGTLLQVAVVLGAVAAGVLAARQLLRRSRHAVPLGRRDGLLLAAVAPPAGTVLTGTLAVGLPLAAVAAAVTPARLGALPGLRGRAV